MCGCNMFSDTEGWIGKLECCKEGVRAARNACSKISSTTTGDCSVHSVVLTACFEYKCHVFF